MDINKDKWEKELKKIGPDTRLGRIVREMRQRRAVREVLFNYHLFDWKRLHQSEEGDPVSKLAGGMTQEMSDETLLHIFLQGPDLELWHGDDPIRLWPQGYTSRSMMEQLATYTLCLSFALVSWKRAQLKSQQVA